MERETRVTIVIFALVAVLALSSGLTHLALSRIPLVSPLSSNYSVFSEIPEIIEHDYRVYGFLPYWSLENAEYLQMDKLTDIAYFALQINADGTIKTRDPDGFAEPGLNKWQNSEALNTAIADAELYGVNFALTMISHNDEITYEFLDCRSCWDTFLSEALEQMSTKGIKNLNLDFELVELAEEGYALKYSEFTGYINNRLNDLVGESNVTVSAHADSVIRSRITDVESLARAADYIFIMAYDFHRPTSDNAGPVAPIGGAGVLSEYDLETMMSDFLKYAPANKLILGVPYYGYNWLVYGEAPYSERIPGSDYLGYSISQTYSAINDTRLKYSPQVLWDPIGRTPYFTYFNPEYGTTRQVYFDNVDSLAVKYDYAKTKGLAGIGIWALGYDGGYQELWDLLDRNF